MVWFPPPDELPAVDLPEMRELRLLFDGKAKVADCPALIALAKGDVKAMREALYWVATLGQVNVLRFPNAMPKKAPYISPQYCAGFGEVMRLGNPDRFSEQREKVMPLRDWLILKAGVKGAKQLPKTKGSIWFGKKSARFIEQHRDEVLGHVLIELRWHCSSLRYAEKELHPLVVAAGLVLLWAGFFLVMYLNWSKFEHMSAWDLAWTAF